ncbi:unnamed protein product [Boreogadus saida]
MGFRSENTLRPERGHLKRSGSGVPPSSGPALSDPLIHHLHTLHICQMDASMLQRPPPCPPLAPPPLATPPLAPPQVPVLVKRGVDKRYVKNRNERRPALRRTEPSHVLHFLLTISRSKVPHRLSNITWAGRGPDHTGTAPHSSPVFPLQPSPETSSPSDRVPLTRVFSVVEVL